MNRAHSWKLGIGQIRVNPGQPLENLARAELAIEHAAQSGASAVLLPEALDCGWTDPSAREFAGTIPGGSAFRKLQDAARRHRVFVASGLVERLGDSLFNAAVLVSPNGELLIHHRKLHELEIAHDLYQRGDRLSVVETELGRIGIMICADAFAPGFPISRTLGWMNAQVILSPCAWAVPPTFDSNETPYGQLWEDSYRPVAQEFELWIAGVSCVGHIPAGPWQGHRCIGNSMVMGPDGTIRFQGSHGQEAEEIGIIQIEIPMESDSKSPQQKA